MEKQANRQVIHVAPVTHPNPVCLQAKFVNICTPVYLNLLRWIKIGSLTTKSDKLK